MHEGAVRSRIRGAVGRPSAPISRARRQTSIVKLSLKPGLSVRGLTLDRAISLGVPYDAGLADPIVHGVVTVSVDPEGRAVCFSGEAAP